MNGAEAVLRRNFIMLKQWGAAHCVVDYYYYYYRRVVTVGFLRGTEIAAPSGSTFISCMPKLRTWLYVIVTDCTFVRTFGNDYRQQPAVVPSELTPRRSAERGGVEGD